MICCFALSGRGWRQCTVLEGVPCIVDTSTHSVGMGGAGLVVLVPGGAGCTCVLDLDFVSVGLTVALLVPGWFD